MPPAQPPSTQIQWNTVTWYSKLLAVVLFVALVFGAFCFGSWYQKQKTLNVDFMTQQTSLPTAISYKKTSYGEGEIPSTWSTYSGVGTTAKTLNDLTSPVTLAYSFSPRGVTFGDGAFSQVDFYYVNKTVAGALIDQARVSKTLVTVETIGGATSTVIHYPTDNGQVDKDGTGGEDYIMDYPAEIGGGTGTDVLLMRKWSLGDQNFENSFQHFLQTAKF